jgi:mxaJ protein
VYGDYASANPPAALIDAVGSGDIDVAIAWGPLAGFFASRQDAPLDIMPVEPQVDQPFLPMAFDMSIAVRRGDLRLLERLQDVVDRRRREVDAILTRYRVPRVDRQPELER